MDALIRNAPRRSDAWVIGRRETMRIEGTRTRVLATRGRSRREVTLRLAVGLGLTGIIGAMAVEPWRIRGCAFGSPASRTVIKLEEMMQEALPAWAVAPPARRCPATLGELVPYLNSYHLDDGWGHRIELTCGVEPRSGRCDVRVRSSGPDGQLATDDDLVMPS